MANKSSQSDKSAAAPPTWSLLESATWSPARAGDNVTGRLGAPDVGPFGEQHTLENATATSSGGEVTYFADGEIGSLVLPHLTTLRDLSRVPIGTLVRITYKGDKVSKAGNTYKDISIETAPSGGGAA